jgi:hypothetical protein
MKLDQITLNGNDYNVREITLEHLGTIKISTVDLNENIIDDNGEYYSEEAARIDEEIYYFVEQEQLMLPEDEFMKFINQDVR